MPMRALIALIALLLAPARTPFAAPAAEAAADDDELLCPEPEARAFDFWIGSWDVLNRNRRPDGTRFYPTGRATNRIYPVVGGCGIVEHWRGHAIGRFIVGFSLRAWDPASEDWRLVLLWPTTGAPSFGELRGTFRHGRGEFSFERENPQDPEGEPIVNRFTFSDITEDSLRWHNATSRDGGQTWAGSWIMEFTRRDPTADGLWNGPSMTTRRCPGEEHRTFDPLLGEWSGTRTNAAGDATPVTVELIRILEGCAVLERVRSADGSWQAFRVRAYEPGPGRWAEYALDAERRFLVRREAQEGDELVFQDADALEGKLTRTRWELDGEGPPRWIVEEADGPDGPWSRRAEVTLDEPVGVPFQPGGG